jgi:hypothetical protein
MAIGVVCTAPVAKTPIDYVPMLAQGRLVLGHVSSDLVLHGSANCYIRFENKDGTLGRGDSWDWFRVGQGFRGIGRQVNS